MAGRKWTAHRTLSRPQERVARKGLTFLARDGRGPEQQGSGCPGLSQLQRRHRFNRCSGPNVGRANNGAAPEILRAVLKAENPTVGT